MHTPWDTPTPPEFSFKLMGEAAKHNIAIMSKCNKNPPVPTFDWPNNLIDWICKVMHALCDTPMPPKFSFELTGEAAEHNIAIMSKYNFHLRRALEANKVSPLGPGKEFKPLNVLREVFGLHPLWPKMKRILEHGSDWPLEEISEEERQQDVLDALTFGNHKGALAKPNLLCKLIGKDIIFGYSLALPLSSVTSIPGICMAPMNIMAQNTIDEFDCIVPKD
jgi:hypothetical protein